MLLADSPSCKIVAAAGGTRSSTFELPKQRYLTPYNPLAKQLVGDRPDRIEPRAIKRRPKPHKLLTKPRAQAKATLLEGASVA
jgi:hypothetical protein